MAPDEPVAMCAYCRARPLERRWRPFCSERCKLLDLGRWIDGGYRVPADDGPGEERPGTVTPEH